MSSAKLFFRELVWNMQDYEYNENDHIVSSVHFDLEVNGMLHHGLYAEIKQALGLPCETAPLEVSQPSNYAGKFNFDAFRRAAESYYRDIVCGENLAGRVPPNKRFLEHRIVAVEIKSEPGLS